MQSPTEIPPSPGMTSKGLMTSLTRCPRCTETTAPTALTVSARACASPGGAPCSRQEYSAPSTLRWRDAHLKRSTGSSYRPQVRRKSRRCATCVVWIGFLEPDPMDDGSRRAGASGLQADLTQARGFGGRERFAANLDPGKNRVGHCRRSGAIADALWPEVPQHAP